MKTVFYRQSKEEVKFVENSLYKFKQTISLEFFKGCLPQIVLGSFLDTFSHFINNSPFKLCILFLILKNTARKEFAFKSVLYTDFFTVAKQYSVD